jgi:hypothetical protein
LRCSRRHVIERPLSGNQWFFTTPAAPARTNRKGIFHGKHASDAQGDRRLARRQHGLSFDQIAQFCKLHPLEVKAIADGESAQGIKGLDPINTGQLTREEIAKAEADSNYQLKLASAKYAVPELRKKGPRYTPVSKRQDRPNAILWLVRNHPELKDAQISRLVGTTKNTIEQIRNRTHWNSANLQPIDPVALGLCSQIDLDFEVQKAAKSRPAEAPRRLATACCRHRRPNRCRSRTSCRGCGCAEGGGEELDADAVFAKLSSLKGSQSEVADESEEEGQD